MKDPFGLKKLDEDLAKVFSPQPASTKKPDQHYRRKQQKSTEQTVKEAADLTKKSISFAYKLATRNKIPKDHAGIMAMRDRLELERRQRNEIREARQRIRELQHQKKIEHQFERREKIAKVKRFIKKILVIRNNNQSEMTNQRGSNEDEQTPA